MGYVIKTPTTAEQSRKAAESLKLQNALRELSDNLQEETDTRAAADSDFQNALDATNATLDDEIALRSSETSSLQANLDTETQARKDADTTLKTELTGTINTVKTNLEKADSDLQSTLTTKIDSETQARKDADTNLKTEVTGTINTVKTNLEKADSDLQSTLTTKINTETQARKDADTNLKTEVTGTINTVKTNLEKADSDLQSTLTTKINTETQARKDADTTLKTELTGTINTVKTNLEKADSDLQSTLTGKINSVKTALEKADSDLQSSITSLQSSLNNKIDTAIANLEKAGSDSQGDITALQNSLTSTINAVKTNLEEADADLQDSITSLQSTLTSTINTVKTNLEKADSGLQGNITTLQSSLTAKIDSESKTRQDAVSDLQGNITALQGSLTSAIESETTARTKALGDLKTTLENKVATESQKLNSSISSLETSLKKYADNKVASVEGSLSDFTAPTEKAAGTRGLVPAPPKGMLDAILTARGWRNLDDSSLTIADLPSQVGSLTYTGSSQSPSWLNFDSNKLKISGTTSSTNAGTFTAYFTPVSPYTWADTKDQAARAVSWTIDPLKLPKPSASVTTFTYNGSAQSLTISDYNSTYESQTGTVSATNANSYSATYKLKSKTNTTWSDGTTADVVISWKIEPLKLTKPSRSIRSYFAYNNSLRTLPINYYDPDYMTKTGTDSATDAGEYSVTISLKSKTNTVWKDGTTADVVIDWDIKPLESKKPYAEVTSFEYDGNSHTLAVIYSAGHWTRTGTITATEPGNYSVTYTLANTKNYIWDDGTTEPVVINWSIGANLSVPTISPTSQASAGLTKASTFTINGYDSDKMSYTAKTTYTVSGNTITTKNGTVQTHSITFSLKDKTNTKWGDETTTNKTVNFSVTKKTLTAAESTFAQTAVIKYDGKSHSVTEAVTSIKAAYIGEYYTLASDTGTFGTIKTSITPTAAATWSDGTQTTKTIEWEIEGATPDLQLASNTLSLSIPYSNNYESASTAPYTKVNFTTNSTGDLTITSSDEYIARPYPPGWHSETIKASAGYFTVYPRANGVATITVTQAAADGFKAFSKTLTVTVTAPCVMLTWGEIQTLTKAGKLSDYMRIGDRVGKQYYDCTVGTLKLQKYLQFMLVGFNHNSGTEGTNRAHFMCDVPLTDANYGKTATEGFIYSLDVERPAYNFNYEISLLRTRCTEFYNAMPTALQNAIVACKKAYIFLGGASIVQDKVWVPSAIEVKGSITGVTNDYHYTAKQYEYFKNGNSRALGPSTNLKYKYWTRDLAADYDSVVYIDEQGEDVSTNTPTYSYGFVPCFAIG